jgi:hypothetical protein
MNMIKRTPGPWKSMPDNYSGEMHRMVVNLQGAPLFDSVNRSPAADDSTEHGDLMLAAAAPELLEALLEVVRISDRKHDAWDAAHAAIAKATGARA